MMTNTLILPKSSWPTLANGLLKIRLQGESDLDKADLKFLAQLGYVDDRGGILERGSDLCTMLHVRHDGDGASHLIHEDMVNAPAAQALLQALSGLRDINVDQAKMALVFAGMPEDQVAANITNFLTILS